MLGVGIVPQSALVTIEIETVDRPWVAARWDLEGSRQQQKRMDEPLDRSARPAAAPRSRVAVGDGRLVDLLARTNQHLACRGRVPAPAVLAGGPSAASRSSR
jgi:hypothetical protein